MGNALSLLAIVGNVLLLLGIVGSVMSLLDIVGNVNVFAVGIAAAVHCG